MKKTVIIVGLSLVGLVGFAAEKAEIKWPEYKFTTVKENPITSVKNQYKSGTCWCFSGLGFLESEVIRIKGITDPERYPDFSEMFVVSHSYKDRAVKYVRLDGALGFSAGSSEGDVLAVIKDYGIAPQCAFNGMNYGTELPEQSELDAVLKGYVDAIVKNPNKKLTTAWKDGFNAVVDSYLGTYPETFEVGGNEYTPETYRDALGIVPDDYVSLTSYTHHPFYTPFIIEVCDNWRQDFSFNLPIDELMSVLENAILDGYTVAWGADVSQDGFTRDGLAVLVDKSKLGGKEAGSDQEHWLGKEEKKASKPEKKGKEEILPPVEFEPTQELRQEWYDNKTVTDDHGMQIYGIAKDQWGNKYYMVKNSWGDTGKYHGFWYASENFVKGQTLNYVIHKSALPQELKDKLGIK